METLPGDLDQRFRVESRLGGGASGQVLLARDQQLGRTVVLKIVPLPASSRQSEAAARVLQEAKILATLRHPRVVTLLDFGRAGDALYLVYPDDAGRDLMSATPSKGRWSTREVTELMDQVLDGLAHLHENDVVHRDLKPANVLRMADGSFKLIDLGLAKDTVRGQDLTATDVFLGTPLFSSPEQVSGADPDPRDDLYSLGVLAYQLLTGRNPFLADTLHEVLRRQLTHQPPPVHEVTAGVPPGLSRFVQRLMAKDREGRPASAAAAREQLAGLEDAGAEQDLEGATRVLAPSSPEPPETPARTTPLLAAVLLLLLALSLGFLGGRSGNPEPPPTARPPDSPLSEVDLRAAMRAASRARAGLLEADAELRAGVLPPGELATMVRLEGLLGGTMKLERLLTRGAESAAGRAALRDWLSGPIAATEAAMAAARRHLKAHPEADAAALRLAAALAELGPAFQGGFSARLTSAPRNETLTPTQAYLEAVLLSLAVRARAMQGKDATEARSRTRALWQAALPPGKKLGSRGRAGRAALGWLRSFSRAERMRTNLLAGTRKQADPAGVRDTYRILAPELDRYPPLEQALLCGEVLRIQEKFPDDLGLEPLELERLERGFRAARGRLNPEQERELQRAFPGLEFLSRLG